MICHHQAEESECIVAECRARGLAQKLEIMTADRDQARKTAEHWKAEHLAGNVEIDRLKALVSLEKRNLQQTIDTANVQLDLWKEYRALLGEEIESAVSLAAIHGWRSTPERVAKGQELRAKLGIPDGHRR